mgnify:CR=1 FL=1
MLYCLRMDSLRSLLPKVLSKRGIKNQAVAALMVHKAQSWLIETLPGLREAIQVQKMQDRVLVIACQNSIAAQECMQLAGRLLEYLEKECGSAPERVQMIRQ